MAKRYCYQVRRNGVDIKGCRWASKQMAIDSLKIEIECEHEELEKDDKNRNYKLFINDSGDIGAIDWKSFIPDQKSGLCYGRTACYTVAKVEAR